MSLFNRNKKKEKYKILEDDCPESDLLDADMMNICPSCGTEKKLIDGKLRCPSCESGKFSIDLF